MEAIDPATWALVSTLLDRTLDLESPDEFLATVRAQQPHIASVLDELLAARARLQRGGAPESSPGGAEGESPLEGTIVGAYTLEAPLGTGGMGSVWRARRSDGRFEGSVALKLLHLTLLDGSGARRFTREGTLLARLSHPHIAGLLDAGLTSFSQPYLVLEYVDGTPIDAYCDAHRLDVRARLGLFQQVLDAVAHAHAHLVVHRDVKPANVLVDGGGQAKLLDFGIAKLLDDDRAAGAKLTATGRSPWTPAYAAPEQVRSGEVTVATDVYALGVLLYELLAGTHPTGVGCTTPAELLRAVVEVDAVPPSVAVASAGADGNRVASARATTPEALARTLRGDLDNILAMALQKAPERRYRSVTALADDLDRHLHDRPVAARPDRWSYRARKFVRRHRLPLAALAIVVATLAASTAVATSLLFEARRQRDEAAFQARRAQASSEFMRNLVTQIGPAPVTMRQVLDRGRQALEQQFGHDPAFVARMFTLLSGPYIELGEHEIASAMVARSFELAKQIDDPALLAAAHCNRAGGDIEARAFARGHENLAEARRQIARLAAPATGLLVECAIAESELASAEERFDAAIVEARRAVALLEREGNTASTRYTSALNNLANVYDDAGNLIEAARAQRLVSDISRRIGRARTTAMMASLNNQAVSERKLGRWLAAERSCREAIDVARGIEASGRIPANLTQNYGRVLADLGRTAEARIELQRALGQPDAPPRVRNTARLALASLLAAEGEVAGARGALAEAEDAVRAAPTPWERATIAEVRARLAAAEGGLDRARAIVTSAMAAERRSPFLHQLLAHGAQLALQAGDHVQGRQLARETIAFCERQAGTEEPSAYAGRAHLLLGLALADGGQAAEARAVLERAATTLTAAAGPDHPWALEARARLIALRGR